VASARAAIQARCLPDLRTAVEVDVGSVAGHLRLRTLRQFSDFGGSALSAAPQHAEAAPPGSASAATTSEDEQPD
jgi:hypothetical protein